MDVVVGLVVGIIGLVGAAAFVLMAGANRAAREGRGDDHLLVAPRGARFGDATELVLQAAREQAEQEHAEIVHLHEVRARKVGAHGHAA